MQVIRGLFEVKLGVSFFLVFVSWLHHQFYPLPRWTGAEDLYPGPEGAPENTLWHNPHNKYGRCDSGHFSIFAGALMRCTVLRFFICDQWGRREEVEVLILLFISPELTHHHNTIQEDSFHTTRPTGHNGLSRPTGTRWVTWSEPHWLHSIFQTLFLVYMSGFVRDGSQIDRTQAG